MGMHRATPLWLVTSVALAAAPAGAGTLVGKLDLPALAPPPATTKGFLERTENPFAPVRTEATHQLVIVVEGDEKPAAPPQITWDLVGESFARPVVAVPAGSEVVIRNSSKLTRDLVARENPKLFESGAINPNGTKSFRANDAGTSYTIHDKDAPYVVGHVVVVNTPYVAYPDETGHFQIDNIAPGNYKVRIWYRDGWLQRPDDSVDIAAKGKTELDPKLAAPMFAPAAPTATAPPAAPTGK